jgi:hypothetical protein
MSVTDSNKSTNTMPVVVAIVITTMTIASLNTSSLLSIASAQSKPAAYVENIKFKHQQSQKYWLIGDLLYFRSSLRL